MKAYQFIQYNNETNIEHINKYAEMDAILCFDFEDSIKNSELKKYYRNCFKKIVEDIIPLIPGIKIGLRINNDTLEIEKDLETISNHNINSIFFPKVEEQAQIENIKNLLSENKVIYDELLPIIESKAGIINLESIVGGSLQKINNIAFGHCDYNLSINAFPFFHQNSIEYWKWIDKIYSIISPKGLSILNSVYLELDNHSFFQSMLHHLYEMYGNNSAQATLTTNQSKLIKEFNPQNYHLRFSELVDYKLELKVPNKYAIRIIEEFEKNNEMKSFSVVRKNMFMISPHEYSAAKVYHKKDYSSKINLTFVGGCFPIQQNILFEDLFHQKFKRKIEKAFNVEFNINIIRYERFNTCLDKIRNYAKSNPIDILVFHVRPEPYLRLVKFYYKYLDDKGKLKRSLNIPFLRILNPEKYDLLVVERRFGFSTNRKESSIHKILVDFNYRVGKLIGNQKYTLRNYFELAANIVKYCKNSNIHPIILGIASRNNTSYAPLLCKELNSYFKKRFEDQNISYIEGLNQHSENNDVYFHSDGIYATEQYHELIAEKLFTELKEEIENRIKTNLN